MDNSLNDRTHLLHALINGLPDIVALQKPDHTVLFYNEAGYRFLNKTPAEIDGRKCFELIGRSVPCEPCATSRAETSKKMEMVERYFPEFNMWLESRAIPVLDDDGNVHLIVEILRDITGQKDADKTLRESEERYRKITESITDYIYTVKVEKGSPTETVHRDGCVAISGYSAEEFAGDPYLWIRMVVPEDRAMVEEQARRILLGEEAPAIEHRIVRKDGTQRWIKNTVVERRNEQGDLISYDGLIQDITDRKMAEMALREAEWKFKALYENSPIGVAYHRMIYNEAGKPVDYFYLDANENFIKLTGVDPRGKRVTESFPGIESDPADWIGRFGQVVVTGESTHFQQYLEFNDQWYEIVAFRYAHDQFVAAFINITELKKAEKALRESEERFKVLFEKSNVSIIIYDKDSGEIIDANTNTLRHYGFSTVDELKANEFWMEPPYSFRDALVWIHKACSEGPQRFEWLNRREGGELFWEDVHLSTININGMKRVLATTIDITERKRAEEALRMSEEKYRLVVENAHEAIFIVQDELIKFPNRRAFILTGYTEEELAGIPFSDIIHEDDKNMVLEMHRKRLRGQNIPAVYSFRIINKSGEQIWVEISAVLISWESRQAALVFLRDITVEKKLEEQLSQAQKMKAIGTLAGGVAHNFNNLLMTILGYTSMLLMKTEKSHPFHEKLRIIEKQVESGAELTKQLLGFAQGGKYEVKPININKLIEETSDIFGGTRKEIAIHKNLQSGLYSIEADSGQMKQVLFNLYVNAWQAMPGGGNIYLETQNVTLDEHYCRPYGIPSGAYIKITVTDTGVGMDADIQKRIFEPFFTTKEVGKGTGLGLASVYGIVKNQGGVINVYSEKGIGTTFTIYLHASEKEATDTKITEEKVLAGNETILIVDDEPTNIEALKELLEIIGYKVRTAQNGIEAIGLYKSLGKGIHLVILDMIMKGMGGKETFLGLKEIDTDVRVLLSSGYSKDSETEKLMEMGCRGFIQKPFRLGELSQKIRSVLDK